MTDILTACLFLIIPAGILWLCAHVAAARAIGAIVLCYVVGIVIGLSGMIPESADAMRNAVMEASLGLALPLLLFSVDVKAWRDVARRAMLSMGLAVIAVTAIASALFVIYARAGAEAPEQLSAMAVGMYTGGIANLGAIKLALDIPDTRYLVFATVDTAIGAVYLLFVLSLAPRLFARFLPRFPDAARVADEGALLTETYRDLLGRTGLRASVVAILAAAICVGLAVTLAPALPFGNPAILTIVLLTTLGIAASFLRPLRENRAAPKLGLYLIYVFSVCVAAGLDVTTLADLDLSILVFVAVATFGSLALHALFCRLFRVDVDTFLITSVAALMSPAFVPMVVKTLKNPAVMMSGMATGILGFAIGNYLGIAVALLLAAGG
ncbi:DUF819 family protein [Shimia biformata]|uniref:DUF819 family protein n=1 Tax=Shimia biformata TaxID=1294299 RepID=UPI00194EB9FB|nr:DUF819 family protein [Shimia biformata]